MRESILDVANIRPADSLLDDKGVFLAELAELVECLTNGVLPPSPDPDFVNAVIYNNEGK